MLLISLALFNHEVNGGTLHPESEGLFAAAPCWGEIIIFRAYCYGWIAECMFSCLTRNKRFTLISFDFLIPPL